MNLFKKWIYDTNFLRRKEGRFQIYIGFMEASGWEWATREEYFIELANYVKDEKRRKEQLRRDYYKALKYLKGLENGD